MLLKITRSKKTNVVTRLIEKALHVLVAGSSVMAPIVTVTVCCYFGVHKVFKFS